LKIPVFNTVYSKLSHKTAAIFERARMTEHTFMIILAIIIGILGGFGGIGIRWLIKFISEISFPGPGNILQNILAIRWYWILIIPVIGGILVGPIITFLAPEAKGHGVPEVMQAILLKGGIIRPRVAFIKAIASAISIGTGGSVGREGPIVQIGSSLGSTVGQFFRVPTKRLKTLVGCGAAAGIAAAFNAPIAGALFAVEIILMDFAVAQFSPIVISSVMATVISHTFEGNLIAFLVPKYELASPYELIFYFVLGAIAGLVSFAFIKTLYFAEDVFDNKTRLPEYIKPAVGGIILGLVALLYPEIMGVGYETINLALKGDMLWYIAFILIFVKIFATSITLGSGGSGGIFAPSLFMGAMLGYFFGSFVHQYFPLISASPNAYALVAMGGMVAGTTRAPITAIIIVFELTNDYRIILPLMITCIISTILSSKLSRESIYTLKLLLRNISIKEGTEANVMETIFVRDVFTEEFSSVLVTDNFSQVINKIIKGKGPDFPVVDRKNNIKGMISLKDLKEYLYERESLKNLLIAGDLANINFDMINIESDCKTAMDIMSRFDFEGLPVSKGDDPNKVIGMIWRKDIQDAYQKAIEAREITSSLASSIVMKDELPQVHFMEGYSISEISAPKSFMNKSIRELDIRARYGVEVLSVKTVKNKSEIIKAIPNADYIIRKDDVLVLAGEIRNINILQNVD
jgi:CIC family chloride channel protein